MCERTLVELLRRMEAITNHLLEEHHVLEEIKKLKEQKEQ